MAKKPTDPARRRILTGVGTLAAAGMLPGRLAAQGSVHEAEVLIIGGGMAGASTAFHLAEQGSDVLLLERGEIASEASGQNMGGLGGSGWGNNPNLTVLPDRGQCRDLQAHADRHGLRHGVSAFGHLDRHPYRGAIRLLPG